MSRESLQQHLHELRSELSVAERKLDDDLHALLRGVADDIENLLGEEPVAPHPGKERLEEIALKFEAEHPRLASILSDISDMVSKLGI